MAKKAFLAVAVGAALVSTIASAGTSDGVYGFDELTFVKHAERIPGAPTGYGGRLGLGIPLLQNSWGTFGTELTAFANTISVRTGRQAGAIVDLVQTIPFKPIDLYGFVGGGVVRDSLAGIVTHSPAVEAGLGLKFSFTDRFRLRASFGVQDDMNDKFNPAKSRYIDYRASVGFDMVFGALPPPPPKDSDGDGLLDPNDRCPQEAANTPDGCLPPPACPAPPPPPPPPPAPEMPIQQIDSDNDSIPDAMDTCPHTLPGVKVDEHGCALPETQKVVLKGVSFLPNEAELTIDAKAILDMAAAALNGQPQLKVEIGGHTDTSGDAKKNTMLSQKRADAVRDYLVSKGIDASRMTAKGYGSTRPIADNKAKEGRVANRRVELKIFQ